MKRLQSLLIVFGCSLVTLAQADDWPQWMGPRRDNVWREDGIIKRFPEGGPKVLWRTPIAGGYAGPAVVGDSLYVLDYTPAEEVATDNFERATFSGVERV